ncbi:MAG TPA: aldo/keto reductase [bacterium]|nr:aldo/keto reductase [bacterium]HPN44325.1 aldo/keto reductase [bacterium]
MTPQKDKLSRRNFLKITAGAAATVTVIPGLLHAGADKPKRTATDKVLLGQSGISVSRLGMGTGSHSGRVQRELGQEGFNNLVKYALEQGITFFDTADNYGEMHEMLGKAIKNVDREKIQIQSKLSWGKFDDPMREIDRCRKEVGTDYFDSMLIHCVTSGDWVEKQKKLMDIFDEAKEKQIIRACGVSIHGFEPLTAASTFNWGDVRLVRINHKGSVMDNPDGASWEQPADVDAVVQKISLMHQSGKGIIGMKLVGDGTFTDAAVREQAIKFVMGLACVDAVVIGFKTPAEIDEAITNMNKYLAM